MNRYIFTLDYKRPSIEYPEFYSGRILTLKESAPVGYWHEKIELVDPVQHNKELWYLKIIDGSLEYLFDTTISIWNMRDFYE